VQEKNELTLCEKLYAAPRPHWDATGIASDCLPNPIHKSFSHHFCGCRLGHAAADWWLNTKAALLSPINRKPTVA